MDNERLDTRVTSIAEMAKEIAGKGTPVGGGTQAEVLRQIAQRAGKLSRGDIAEGAHLSTATASKAVAHLMKLKLVDDGAGGRRKPGATLRWTDDYAQVGVAITSRDGRPSEFVGTVTRLDGSALPSFGTDGNPDKNPRMPRVVHRPITDGTQEGVLKELSEFVKELLRDAPSTQVLGCGVSVGGHVDKDGNVRKSFNTGWSDFKLQADLAELLKADGHPLDVVVENDVTSYSIHKNLTSRPPGSYALVAVLRDGVGAAIGVDGKTRRGAHGLAGEIGHIYVGGHASGESSPLAPGKAPVCRCGSVGCVEAFATPKAIFSSVYGEKDFDSLEFEQLASTNQKETEVTEAFADGGRALGRGLASLIYLFDPAMIFLYLPPALTEEKSFLAGYAYLDTLRKELGEHVYIGDGTDPLLNPQTLLNPEKKSESELEELAAVAAASTVLGRLIQKVRLQ